MNFAWVRPLLRRTGQAMVKNAPGLLMGLGTAGVVTGTVYVIKVTPEANDRLIQAKLDKAREMGLGSELELPKLTLMETVKTTGKYYIPGGGLILFGLGCFWSAHGIDVKRQAVLAGLYSTAEQALMEYQKKVAEMIGKNDEKAVRTELAQDKVNANPPPTTNLILSRDDEMWCLIDQQYFRSSFVKIKDAQNDANAVLIQHLYLSRSELYWLLDPERKYLKTDGDSGSVGWSVDRMLNLDICATLGPNHEPILVVEVLDKDGMPYPPQPGYSMTC